MTKDSKPDIQSDSPAESYALSSNAVIISLEKAYDTGREEGIELAVGCAIDILDLSSAAIRKVTEDRASEKLHNPEELALEASMAESFLELISKLRSHIESIPEACSKLSSLFSPHASSGE